MRKYSPEMSLIMLLMYMHIAIGCTYYKVTNAESIDPVSADVHNNSRYFIVHQGSNAWHFSHIALDNDKEQMTGTLETLPETHKYYQTTNPEGPNRIKVSSADMTNHQINSNNPAYEVHFYISEYMEDQNAQITIPIKSIKKIEIYDKDVSANTVSSVFTALGIAAGVLVVVGVIVALTKSSCPFVYTHDGSSYHFAGEMYGGAIYSSLERNDFMPLPGFTPSQGEYQLMISNKLLERQYTNLAELIVVEHPGGSKVLLDKNGHIETLFNPETPLKALSDKNIDHTKSIESIDSSSYLFDEECTTNKELSNLNLTFNKPLQSSSGKLVINIKNSYWLDYVYGKFNEQFGTYFNAFSEAQKSVPARKINQWTLDQNIPLSVYVQTDDGWKFIDYFNVTGPLASRQMVMVVDLSKVHGQEVKIKLESGFMFWDLDYVAMDFSEDIPVKVSNLSATSAIDEKGREVSALLAFTDDGYLVQPEVGNEVTITYPSCEPENNNLQTVFLHSGGYYEYIRDYKNMPDFIALSSFKQKGSFAKFSKRKYNEFVSKAYLFDDAISVNDEN